MTDKSKEIEALIDKAANAHDALAALQFSQAASNIAHAIYTLASAKVATGQR